MGTGAPSPGVKRPRRQAEHSLYLFPGLRSSSSVSLLQHLLLCHMQGHVSFLHGHICVVLCQNGKGNVKFILEEAMMAHRSRL